MPSAAARCRLCSPAPSGPLAEARSANKGFPQTQPYHRLPKPSIAVGSCYEALSRKCREPTRKIVFVGEGTFGPALMNFRPSPTGSEAAARLGFVTSRSSPLTFKALLQDATGRCSELGPSGVKQQGGRGVIF